MARINPLRADKTYRQGADRVLSIFIGEMQSLNFENEEIITAVIERCDPDAAIIYQEVKQQLAHLEEITNAPNQVES
jgi:hypothetical protein